MASEGSAKTNQEMASRPPRFSVRNTLQNSNCLLCIRAFQREISILKKIKET